MKTALFIFLFGGALFALAACESDKQFGLCVEMGFCSDKPDDCDGEDCDGEAAAGKRGSGTDHDSTDHGTSHDETSH